MRLPPGRHIPRRRLETRDAKPVRGERAARIEDGLVLGRGGDDVAAPTQRASPLMARLSDSVAPEVKTISSGSTPIAAATAPARGRPLRAPVRRRHGRARGVAEHLHEVGDHRVEHAGVHGRRRVAVEIDRKLHGHGRGCRVQGSLVQGAVQVKVQGAKVRRASRAVVGDLYRVPPPAVFFFGPCARRAPPS